MRVPPSSVPSVVRGHLRETEAATLDAVVAAADAVADAADPPAALDAELHDRRVYDALPQVLVSAVAATGRSLTATPVAAPPYVVVAGEGPVLRATLDDGRLVVTLRVFAVERGPTYRRLDGVDVGVRFR